MKTIWYIYFFDWVKYYRVVENCNISNSCQSPVLWRHFYTIGNHAGGKLLLVITEKKDKKAMKKMLMNEEPRGYKLTSFVTPKKK